MPVYTFDISLHAAPEGIQPGPVVTIDGRPVRTLSVPQANLSKPFAVDFETAGAALSRRPGLFFEPDGAFVYVSPPGDAPWQVDGNLFDRNGRLLYVVMKGACPQADFDNLLADFGWPKTPMIFLLVRQAVFLDEGEFRRHALKQG